MYNIIKKYNQAPLPFMGQKRRFVKQIIELLKDFDSDTTFVDLFGGSGLLAHTAKYVNPESTVVYNDFDNYSKRLRNIKKTNELLSFIREVLQPVTRRSKVPEHLKIRILNRLKQEEKEGNFVDYLTISTSTLFSMNYVKNLKELEKQTFYNTSRKTDFSAQGYLEGVEVVHADYRKLFEKYKNVEKAVFLVDPPYLSTEVKSYQKMDSWGVADYLDILNVLNGTKFIYFTSNKSEIVELCEWFETRTFAGNPFKYATTSTINQSVNYNSSYTDIMIHKLD